MRDSTTVVCEAIRARRLLTFEYDGYTRVVKPHGVGQSTASEDMLLAWFVWGHSASGREPGWRMYRLAEMRTVRVLEEEFAGPREGFDLQGARLGRVECVVEGDVLAS